LRDKGYAEIPIVEDIDTIWFFKDHREPVIIRATIDLEQRESSVLRELSFVFQEIRRVELELRIEKIADNKVRLKMGELSLIGYVTASSKKADRLLKTLNESYEEEHSMYEVVKDGKIIEKDLFSRLVSMIKSNFHYITLYEGVPASLGIETLMVPRAVLPDSLKEALDYSFSRGKSWKRQRFTKYAERITKSTYNRLLEKRHEHEFFKYTHFGGGDQVIDSLITYMVDRGEGHIFLIEEPEIHLHPSYVMRLGELLEELVRDENIQVIMITHSPVLIKSLHNVVQKLYLVRMAPTREGLPSTRVLRLKDLSKAPQWFVRKNLFFSDVIILVEGMSDELIIDRCIYVMRGSLETLSRMHVSYLHYADKGIKTTLNIVTGVRDLMDMPIFIITDGDEQGKKNAEEALKMGFKNETFTLDVEDIFFCGRRKFT